MSTLRKSTSRALSPVRPKQDQGRGKLGQGLSSSSSVGSVDKGQRGAVPPGKTGRGKTDLIKLPPSLLQWKKTSGIGLRGMQESSSFIDEDDDDDDRIEYTVCHLFICNFDELFIFSHLTHSLTASYSPHSLFPMYSHSSGNS
jgi:hypothetical protein